MERVFAVASDAFLCDFLHSITCNETAMQDLDWYALNTMEMGRIRGGLEKTVEGCLQQFVKGDSGEIWEASCSGLSTERIGNRSDGKQRPPVD